MKWEYLVARINPEQLGSALKRYGNKEWELILVENDRWIFKRPLEEAVIVAPSRPRALAAERRRRVL